MQTVTFTNSATPVVNISSLSITGPAASDFSVTSDSGEAVLLQGQSRTVTVTYDPAIVTRSGARDRLNFEAEILILRQRNCPRNDSNGSSQQITQIMFQASIIYGGIIVVREAIIWKMRIQNEHFTCWLAKKDLLGRALSAAA